MKKFFKSILVIITLVILSFNLNKYLKNGYKEIRIEEDKVVSNVLYKGLKGALDFCIKDNGDYYIAYKDKIQVIENNGKSYMLFKDKNLDISSIELDDANLYYASSNCIYCYNLESNINKCLINNIPNFGDYKNSKIKKQKDYLYATIGAATNSGVVGDDNKWLQDKPYNCDISPKTIMIKGLSFGKEKTGAFVPHGTLNIKGQIIPGHFPGNASVIIYNLKNGTTETFCWGVRNIEALDFNNNNNLIAVVGGIEDRGLRSVKGDTDYIYEIKRGMWYGWPDYTGGDPINSPRFKGRNDESIGFILDKHPCTNPPAPLYQHKSVDSLCSLAVDREGILGIKDSVYFYDYKYNKIYSLSKKGVLKEEVSLYEGCKINALKFTKEKAVLLDGNNGILYELKLF